MEPWAGRGRLRGPSHRHAHHHRHVLRPLLLDRGDVAGSSSHGRGVLVLTLGDGPVGRLRDGSRGDDRIRRHPRRCRDLRGSLPRVDLEELVRREPTDVVLAVFYVGALTEFSWDRLTNIKAEAGNSDWFPFGVVEGTFLALPFAIWFYLAIEELPLAAEESHDPKRDIPRGTIYGLLTLVVTGFLVLFLNTGVSGAEEIRTSGEPLLDGFRVIFGEGGENTANVLGLAAVAGIIASFHTIIYAYGRNIFSLSRAGYYPHFLSVTHGRRNTPHVALVVGAIVGFGLAFLVDQALKNDWLGGNLYAALLSMAVAGAVGSYVLQMISFILLRRKLP